jgi:aminoglycoside 3-N-acetyltransferase
MPTESEAIAQSSGPATVESLATDLRELGLASDDVAIVHSSMSRLGWVAGGAQSVVEALLTVVGPAGTVVMPTQSGQLTDPAGWSNPPVPPEWIAAARDGLPAYDPDLTPTRGMGAVVDCFRHHPDTIRSPHPHVSFAANGRLAREIVGSHPLAPATGDASPLGRLYELDAVVLLLGVTHLNNTSLHLAEERAGWDGKRSRPHGAPMLVDGERRWVVWDDLDRDVEDFEVIGDAFAGAGLERTGPVGAGTGRLSRQRDLVDFAVDWMSTHRPGSLT